MTNTNITIRPAQPSDARSVAKVHVESWQQAYRDIVPDAYLARLSIDKREAIWRKSINDGSPELWVAESTAGILGWVALGASRDDDATSVTGEIEAIYLDPLHWRQGIGKALWLHARQRLIARGFAVATLWVLADNERAIRFYEAQGFRQDQAPARVSERDGKQLVEVRYEIELAD